ncbi:MAG: DNA cytosine methyltransferase, partial [Bacteriovoracia bacterium]
MVNLLKLNESLVAKRTDYIIGSYARQKSSIDRTKVFKLDIFQTRKLNYSNKAFLPWSGMYMRKTSGMTFIDLFCGCGGLSYGLEMAGHHCLLGVDMEPSAIDSFKRNHPQAEAWNGDIKKLDARTLKKLIGTNSVDMVVGGPPC